MKIINHMRTLCGSKNIKSLKMSFLIILVLFVAIPALSGGVYSVTDDDLERTITLDNYKLFKGGFEELEKRSQLNDLTIIEIKDGKSTSKCVGETNVTRKISKISKKLENNLSTIRRDEKIEVFVMSKWNVNEDSFNKCVESIIKKTKYEKVKFNTARIRLSKSQIQKFSEKDEIFKILLPEENTDINSIEQDFEYDIESKLSYGLQDITAKKGTKDNKEKCELVIYSDFSSPIEDVIEALKHVPFKVEAQKRTFDSLTTKLSLNEIIELENLEEIRKICLVSETIGVNDNINIKNSDKEKRLR